MTQRRILVVEDDPKVRALLRTCFETDGFEVEEAADAASALEAFAASLPDLVTLDLNLGSDNGLEVAREMRRAHTVPIIMVTARDDVIDRVVGLELGADDYITKPFHVREMLARVRSVLRRTANAAQEPGGAHAPLTPKEGALDLDGLTVDLHALSMLDRARHPLDLTTADFKLLSALLDNPNRALSRDRLMDMLNGLQWSPLDRTIDNQIARLRRKIERNPARPTLIKTVRGVGYMLTMAGKPKI